MFSILFLFISLIINAIGDGIRISDVGDFAQFKDNVNNRTSYSGTTVFLDSGLSLAGKTVEPIGTGLSISPAFFCGPGHATSNIKMTSSLENVEFFGYSREPTIRNLILNSSCSITSTYDVFVNAYVGGIIEYCYTNDGPCIIENSVNMEASPSLEV